MIVLLFLILDGTLYVLAAVSFGAGVTIIGMIATTLLGLLLLRTRARVSFEKLIHAFRSGMMLDAAVLSLSRTVIGGVLLVIPGLVTDIIGLLIILPVVGPLFSLALLHMVMRNRRGGAHADHTIIDADSRDLPEAVGPALPRDNMHGDNMPGDKPEQEGG